MRIFLIIAVLCVVGCSLNTPLEPVFYTGDVEVTTSQSATIKFDSGIVTGASGSSLLSLGGNTFVPISTGPIVDLHFDEQDQLTFLRTLSSELTRLNVLNVIESGKNITLRSDHDIRVIFLQTHHDPSYHIYTLDVAFQIGNNEHSFANKYRIVSHSNMKEKLFTNASQGKKKAAKKLLKALIDDIQNYLFNLEYKKRI